MELRFALLYDGNRLDIEEPIGFDSFEPELRRNDMHGVSVEYSDVDLEFTDCEAIDIIKKKYELSLDSEIDFIIEMNCNAESIKEIYRGRLDLSTYQFLKKEYTSVKCKVGQVGVFTTFNNRLDTDVCLDDLTSIDGNPLRDYELMNSNMQIPGKSLMLMSGIDSGNEDSGFLPCGYDFNYQDMTFIIIPGMMNVTGSDIAGIFNYSMPEAYRSGLIGDTMPFYEVSENAILHSDIRIDGILNFTVRATHKTVNHMCPDVFSGGADVSIKNEEGVVMFEATAIGLVRQTTVDGFCAFECGVMMPFSIEKYVFKSIFLQVNIKIRRPPDWSYDYMVQDVDFTVNMHGGSFVRISSNSILPPTKARTFMLHEALSRISESITDNGLSVFSDYYGRTDSGRVGEQSMLNEVVQDGIGAYRCITNGYKLRRYIYTEGSPAKMYLSMKKAINSLSAIDNIGCGFSFENGKWVVRVENWKWFYNDTKLFDIQSPSNVIRSVNESEINTRLHVGYKKYAELSESNVVDTFHSERNYSTLLKAVDKKIEAVSDFVADAYAVEYTRRKSIEKDTRDWSYDEDIFILCLLKRDNKYVVDNGMQESDNTVISPETMLNIQISPARNARRWSDRMCQYSGVDRLKYISGTRNTNARGRSIIKDAVLQIPDDFVIENDDIALPSPLIKAETIEFDYPISLEQFNKIRINPYGYILVDGEKCYIKSVKYNFKTTLANLVLIPSAI